MKKNNLKKFLSTSKQPIIIMLSSFLITIISIVVIVNAKSIKRALSFGDNKPISVNKHTPTELRWADSFKGVDNMDTKK